MFAIRQSLGLPAGAAIPPVNVRLGTTRGTNALLTRTGAKAAFITTRGFGDILRIGYQNRSRLFDLNIRKPQPLFAAVVEVDERMSADGFGCLSVTKISPSPSTIACQAGSMTVVDAKDNIAG